MKRAVLLYLLLVSAALAVQAAYTIQLKDGRVITADGKILVKDDMVYFTRRGVYFFLQASQVDVPATDRQNAVVISNGFIETAPVVAPKVAGVKPVVIGEEQLEVIRGRSRLANEGQLTAPAASPGESGVSARAAAKAQAGDRNSAQSKLTDLLQQQTGLQKDQTSLQNEVNSLTDQYNNNVQQADREKIEAQIEAVKSQLQSVQNGLTTVQGQLQSTQQELNSTPIVVDMGNQESPAAPASSNPPKSAQ